MLPVVPSSLAHPVNILPDQLDGIFESAFGLAEQ